MRKIRFAMAGCAKTVCRFQHSPLLSRFTPPVAASLSKQPACGFRLPTRPKKFPCLWQISKNTVLPQARTQQYSSLSSRPPEWKELSSEAQQSRLILVDGKALVYRAYYRISAKIFHGSLKKMTGEDLPENSSWDSIMTTVVALEEILNLLELQPSHAAVRDSKQAHHPLNALRVEDNTGWMDSWNHGIPDSLTRSPEEHLPFLMEKTRVTTVQRERPQIEGYPGLSLLNPVCTGLTFRHSVFREYKSHRSVTPDTVRHAVRDTKHALLGMGVKVIEVPGVEADDVIGTLSLQAIAGGMKVRVASQDKDFFQILSPELRLLRFAQKGSGFLSFGLEDFELRYPGLQASQFVDMQALVGDVADNIPGVRGIGDVTARKLISQFGTLENLLEQRDKIAQTRARNILLEDTGQVLLSKYLLLLKLNIPEFAMGCSLQNLCCRGPEDGGRSYSALIQAFGAIVGTEVGAALSERTFEYWRKL